MKRLILILAVLMLFPLTSFAAPANNATAGSPLQLTGLTISVSPGVFAYYTDGSAANPQWYLVGTVHQGGKNFYATAQNSTSIFKQPTTAPTVIGDLTGLTYPTQAQAASETYWSDSTSWGR